jgi:hypothetical protein
MPQYIKICPSCNFTFSHRKNNYIYCSRQCAGKAYSQKFGMLTEHMCLFCSKTFSVLPSGLNKKYCNRECANKAHSIRMRGLPDRICPSCNKTFVPRRAKTKFCSPACRFEGQKLSPGVNFWPYVSKSSTCWIWQGGINHFGYGVYCTNSTLMGAHRFSYILENGPIPKGMVICHKCDNPPCVNPDHLFLGTPSDNLRDMVQKGRNAKGEKSGNAKLSVEQVKTIRDSFARGELTKTQLARIYHVTFTNIHYIIGRKIWTEVA